MMSKTTGERGMSKMTRPKTFRCARGLHPETYSVMIAKFRNLLEEVLMRKVSLILLALAVSGVQSILKITERQKLSPPTVRFR